MKRLLLFLAGLLTALLTPFLADGYRRAKYRSYYPEKMSRVPKALRGLFR